MNLAEWVLVRAQSAHFNTLVMYTSRCLAGPHGIVSSCFPYSKINSVASRSVVFSRFIHHLLLDSDGRVIEHDDRRKSPTEFSGGISCCHIKRLHVRYCLLSSVHNVDSPCDIGDAWARMIRGGCVSRHSLCVGELWYVMYCAFSRARGFIFLITVVPIIGVIYNLNTLGMFVHGHFGSTNCDSLPRGLSPRCRIPAKMAAKIDFCRG